MLILTHSACLEHDPGEMHPESPARLREVLAGVKDYAAERPVDILEAPEVTREALLRVHPQAYIDRLERLFPTEGRVQIDPDTIASPGTREAVYRGAGAVEQAVDEVLSGHHKRVFCAVRPPGHHAEPEHSMGFCLFNNVAIGVASALAAGIERIAIVDFDVHHGNGTEACFGGDKRVLFCSLFQYPLYPDTGLEPPENCVCVPLDAGTDGPAYREAFYSLVEPALGRFQPQLVFISAGFDAHVGDPLAGLMLQDEDYAWLTEHIVSVAERSAKGRVISNLEGGYNLAALRGATFAHLCALGDEG